MKLKTTGFVVANLIMPLIVGGIMAKFIGDANCLPSWIPAILPCWIWHFLMWAFITALILDLIMYGLYPVIRKFTKWKNCITPVENHDTDKPYIGATIENKEKHFKKFYCVLKSIERNGKIDRKLTDQITKHTPRMSWSGGSDDEAGIKHIDTKATLNLVSLNKCGGLTFETAKGEVNPDEGTGGTGNYKLNLELNKQVGENEFSKMPLSIYFEFYYEGIPASQLQYAGARLSGPLANIGIRLVNKK